MSESSPSDQQLVLALAQQSFEFDATSRDAERNCWLAVHRHIHGVLPSEYDIREIDEALYCAVLQQRQRIKEAGGSPAVGSA